MGDYFKRSFNWVIQIIINFRLQTWRKTQYIFISTEIQMWFTSVAFLYFNNELCKKYTKKTIYNSNKKSKILRYKLNQGDEKSVYWKLQNFDEWNQIRHK